MENIYGNVTVTENGVTDNYIGTVREIPMERNDNAEGENENGNEC